MSLLSLSFSLFLTVSLSLFGFAGNMGSKWNQFNDVDDVAIAKYILEFIGIDAFDIAQHMDLVVEAMTLDVFTNHVLKEYMK